MGMVRKEKIMEFFDKMSINRNLHLASNPILKYEQGTRQRAVIELLEPTRGDKMLDVGCGNARDILVYLKTGADCVGIDFSISMVLEGKKELPRRRFRSDMLLNGDITKLCLCKFIWRR
ncbi:MAG: methyltransferase domain-containing protein [Thermoplasmatales archaeon]|nr:methyltransferase domain-containing protein [Thermoplasmatales archaeon]